MKLMRSKNSITRRHRLWSPIRTIVILLLVSIHAAALNLNKEIDLSGTWLFEIGDNLEYVQPGYNDSKWETINVPGIWENEGFPGYDGYGWYRVSFVIPKELSNKVLYLKLGQIDDVDRTYFNGRFIGGNGDFPPSYQTAYDVNRIYELPSNFINFGKKNTLAVRIYDDQGGGGIMHGKIGIYSREDVIDLQVDLSGIWQFKKGDDLEWANPDLDDSRWRKMPAPSHWEQHNFSKHDGFAWYRKSIRIGKTMSKKKLILLLGKINDIDQAYFNGVKIGETGNFPVDKSKMRSYRDKDRAYFIPPYLIRANKLNVISVRVYDFGKNGGIYSGYLGIASRSDYLKYSKKAK
jgi:hypothetical protein